MASLTIGKWLPVESEEIQMLFIDCKQVEIEAEGIVDNLGSFLCDLKYNNIKKTHSNSIDLPFRVEDLELIGLKLKTVIDSYTTLYMKLKTSSIRILHLKVEKVKEKLWKIKLKLMYLLNQLINEIAHTYVYYGEQILQITLRLSEMFNRIYNLDEKFENKFLICSNTCAYLLYPFRKITITKILQILAQKRTEICCHELIDCLLNTYKANENMDDETSSDSSMEIYRALTRHLTPPSERKKNHSSDKKEENIEPIEHFESMEDMIANEENNVIILLNVAMQVTPTFLGSDGIKISKTGESRINSKAKIKVLEYYEQILWMEVGNCLEHIILWWGQTPLSTRPPHSSQHLREWILQFLPLAEIPGFIISAIQSLADALSVHVTSTSWDQNFRLALVASKKLSNPNTGQLFCDMLADLVQMSNQCEITNDWVVGAPLEELPLVEQIPILHRLDHSVHTTRLWTKTETKRLANNWSVDSFFMITHTDIANCLQQLSELKLADHSIEITKGGLQQHTNVCANMRAKLVSEVQDNIKKLKETTDECIKCLANVCKTISLANLQMVFPEPSYWQSEGCEIPDIASPYVAKYLDRILTPVFGATTKEIICNMVLKIMCEAWLDHIYMNKIKFSQHGAYQLLRDFAAVAEWLSDCPIIAEETKKLMVKNEVLRKCEGVGRLLLRSPGEQIKMNNQENKKESDSPEGELEQLMPAEMYVPNQEQWLELRASKKKTNFIPSCIC